METLKRMPFKAQKMLFEKLEEIGDVAKLPARERRMYERNLDIPDGISPLKVMRKSSRRKHGQKAWPKDAPKAWRKASLKRQEK